MIIIDIKNDVKRAKALNVRYEDLDVSPTTDGAQSDALFIKTAPHMYTIVTSSKSIDVYEIWRMTLASIQFLFIKREGNLRVPLLLLCTIYFITTMTLDEQSCRLCV
jgi:hypothetical protein